jgi:hypothetical protein
MATEAALKNRETAEDTSAHRSVRNSSEQVHRAVIADLQLQIQEISSRVAEVDIEKAERVQLRADLKNLEHQLQVNIELMAARLEQCEKRFSEPMASTSEREADSHLPALLERLNRLEDRLGKVDLISKQISNLEEDGKIESKQLSTLQDQYSLLRKEVVEIKFHVERLCRTQEDVKYGKSL